MQYVARALHLTKRYANLVVQRDQLLIAQEKHVAENKGLTGELNSTKMARIKDEGERNEALKKVGNLEKFVETGKAQISSMQKEKEQLEKENAELSEKLKDARRQAIKDFMASDQFNKMSMMGLKSANVFARNIFHL